MSKQSNQKYRKEKERVYKEKIDNSSDAEKSMKDKASQGGKQTGQ